MEKELNQLHEHLFKPILSSRKYLNSSKMIDAILEIGLAVRVAAPPSVVRLRLATLAAELDVIAKAYPEWIQTRLNPVAAIEAFDQMEKALSARVTTEKPGKPKAKPTSAKTLQKNCIKKRK